MLVFGTQMHIVTFVFVILEIAMFFYQTIYYLFRPQDRNRLWYMILLFLLIIYNITGGIFPDDGIEVPIVIQNIIAYGSGFLMASYFPFYFYKGLELKRLRFHAIYGVPFFLILPYLIFFVVGYSLNGNLDLAIKYGVIIPFFYAVVVLIAILISIRTKYLEATKNVDIMEMVAVYCAVIPWVSMPVLAYLHASQLTEVMFSNIGFLIITLIFISKSVKKARREHELLMEVEPTSYNPQLINNNCKLYALTAKEAEIAELICQRIRFKDIADKLFISPRTVDKHAENIYKKVTVSNREELIRKLNSL
ncbi:helix-turn-helix transcriptional regulator [Pedobacter rhodius]|uniref:Helix-turn-helix transcriptional regulator n=1 Tax=Pedobacter rhodius TaxID=3004098 RepID=A0ABT4KX71_9SPHI|nr:helix-turn-helix transcriptional regulator [Pedobacter sp. SJ11]MCZ4223527.1 helix-turn-helix transcriptional regulator [Pedobacter sp. SJ11]